MNPDLKLMLMWARREREDRFIAFGYLLACGSRMDPVDAAYARNVIMARILGVSA
jgi:hypothetical protein